MRKQQLKELVGWIKGQIEFSTRLITEANDNNNYGKETHYKGVREAFQKMLNRLPR